MNKIKNFVNWFKKLFYIVKNYDMDMLEIDDDISMCKSEVRNGVKLIKDRTNIHVNAPHYRGSPTQVITIGRYRKRDYVQVFSVYNDGDFQGLIDQLREMERYGNVGRSDCPIELDAAFDREFINTIE